MKKESIYTINERGDKVYNIGAEGAVMDYEYDYDTRHNFKYYDLEKYETNGLKEFFDIKKIITSKVALASDDYKDLDKVYLGNGEWGNCSEKQKGELWVEYDKRKDEEIGKGLDIWAKELAEKDKKFEPIGWDMHYSLSKQKHTLSINGIRHIEEEDSAEIIAKKLCQYGSAMDLVSLYTKKANKKNCYVTDREMECMQKILAAAIKVELNQKIEQYKSGRISKAKYDAYVLKYNIARTKLIPNIASKWAAQKQQREKLQKSLERQQEIMDKIEEKVTAFFDKIEDKIEERRERKEEKRRQKSEAKQQQRDEHVEKTTKDLDL